MAKIGDPHELSQHMVEYLIGNLLHQRGAIIPKRPSDDRSLVFVHGSGVMHELDYVEEMHRLNGLIAATTNGVVNSVLRSGKAFVVSDVTRHQNDIVADNATRSEACFPLVVKNRCIGVLNFESPVPNFFDADDVVLL